VRPLRSIPTVLRRAPIYDNDIQLKIILNPEHVRAHLSSAGVQNFEAEMLLTSQADAILLALPVMDLTSILSSV